MLLGRRFHVRSLVHGIKLPAFDRVEEDFGGFLYAFEKGIIFGGAGGGFLVRMMAKNLFTVCALDLGFGSLVAIFRKAKDSVVVLSLGLKMSVVDWLVDMCECQSYLPVFRITL